MLFPQYNYALFFNLLRRDNQIISTPIAPTITDIGNQCSFIVSPALGKDTLPSAFNNPLNNPLPLPSVNVFSGFGVGISGIPVSYTHL